MKVRFKVTFCGAVDYYTGEVYEVSENEASALIQQGFAEPIDKVNTANTKVKANTAKKEV